MSFQEANRKAAVLVLSECWRVILAGDDALHLLEAVLLLSTSWRAVLVGESSVRLEAAVLVWFKCFYIPTYTNFIFVELAQEPLFVRSSFREKVHYIISFIFKSCIY